MKSLNPKRNVAVILLVSLLLQSCGVEVPVVQLQQGEPIGVQGGPVVESAEGSSRTPELGVQSDPGTASASPAASFIDLTHSPQHNPSRTYTPSSQQLYDYIHGAGRQITSVKGLVEAYNNAQNIEDRLLLHEWLRNYLEWFSEKPIAPLDEGQIREYAYLAHIQPRTHEDQVLLRSYLTSIFSKIDQNRFGAKHLIRSLSDVLEKINKEAFEDTAELISIGNVLLGKIIPNETVLTRDNYPTHETILTALHSTLLLISQLATEGWSDAEDSLYQDFQAKISAIKRASKYYPVTYYSQLLGESLATLRRIEPRTFSDCVDDARQTIKTIASVYQVARGMLSLEIDIRSWEEAYQQLQTTGTQLRSGISTFLATYRGNELSWSWHDHLLDLTSKSIADFDSDGTYDAFKEKIESLEQLYQDQWNERLFLRYGVIRQLTLTALRDPNPTIRKQSLEKLEALTYVWDRDKEIAEGLLESIGVIAKQGYGDEAVNARAYLQQLYSELTQTDEQPVTPQSSSFLGQCFLCFNTTMPTSPVTVERVGMPAAMNKWLGTKTLNQKLSIALSRLPQLEHRLFAKVQADLKVKLHHRIQAEPPPVLPAAEMQALLRSHYQAPHFKEMSSFLGEAPMSVEVIECHLKLNEQKKVEDKESQDQFAQREERLQWVKTPVEIKDLFKKRSLKPKEPEKEINKVLLVGEAGTGKTSLTRKLAHDWAVGKWGQGVTAVYVLPVRTLKVDKYDNNGHPCRDANLSTAIANECFAGNKVIDDFKKLRRCIEASLNDPGTLVILDGLDEQHGTSEAILREAKSGNHKLFLTSRPYGIETERSLVDMAVDHMGLDVAQRDSFVKHALQDSTGLLTFIQGHRLNQQQGAVPAMAHVPVNLKILCALWKEKSRKLLEQKAPMGLPSLYRELVDYVWERFEKQSQETTDRLYTPEDQLHLFQDLEKIALTGLESGEIIITPSTIKEAIGKRPYPLLQNAGLLLLQKVDRQYQFPHLTFQEYFTGRRLARQFLTGERQAVTKFLRQHMYTPRYRRTLYFMSGESVKGMPSEVGSTSSGEELVPIQALLHLAAELPEEILGLQYLVLQLRLLNEWLLVVEDPEEKAETMLAIEAKFHLRNNLITWFNAGLRQYRQYGDKSTQVLYTTLITLLSEASGVTKHYGTELRKYTLNALKDSASDVRSAAREALRILVEQGAEVQQLLPPILNDLNDSDSVVRWAALEVLGTLLEKGAEVQQLLPLILNALKDGASCVRSAALQALPTLLEHGAEVQQLLPPILNALKDSASCVCSAALQALPTLLEHGAEVQQLLPPILNALKDSHSYVRRAALQALPTLLEQGAEVQQLLPPIFNALKDSHSYVRRAAREALPTLLEHGA
ncbi:MAG: HEAT repeat domain-containing protein, partial [Bacteroidota bacterium]